MVITSAHVFPWWFYSRPFNHDEFARLGPDSEATYWRLKDKLEALMHELKEPFAFRKLYLTSSFDPYMVELLPNCPDLQHMEVSMMCQHDKNDVELLEVLASNHPRLWGTRAHGHMALGGLCARDRAVQGSATAARPVHD